MLLKRLLDWRHELKTKNFNPSQILSVLLAFVLLCSPLLSDVAQTRPVQNSFYSATTEQKQSAPGTLLKIIELKPPAFFRAKAWKILYNTRDTFGRPILSSGVVIMSSYAPRDPAKRKIVAWAHPTTGVNRDCAPSQQKWPGQSILGLNEFISAGYIVVATDYPGLGTLGPVGYMVGRGQGQAVLDSVRAAEKIPSLSKSNDVVLWGYSQGGHAVQFASHLAQTYAPELNIMGMAAVAPPTDLARLLVEDINSVEGRVLASFVLKSWSLKYELNLATIINPSKIAALNSVATTCVNNFSGQIAAFEAQDKLRDSFLSKNPLVISPWRDLIRDNSLRGFSTRMPNFVFQGGNDSVVRPEVTSASVRNACRSGAAVKYVFQPGYSHGSSAKASVVAATAWIRDRFAGLPAPNNCK